MSARPCSTRPRRRLRRAALVVALVGLATSCIDAYTGNPDGPTVAVIGDSITALAADEYRTQLATDYQVSVNGQPGYTIAEQLPTAREYADTAPAGVVIALGTNDDSRAIQRWKQSPNKFVLDSLRDLKEMISLFPAARCIVLVNVTTHVMEPSFQEFAEDWNKRIVQQALQLRPGMRLANWDAETAKVWPEQLTTDTVHVTPFGATVLVGIVRAQLDSCLRPV
jgi:hypothetical protein